MLAELRQDPRYADLQMADLQAVLWYAEKRLYETAKEDMVITGDDVVGYEDEDAPDYANAAAAVARANGVPEPKIKAALKKESKDGRAAAARRSNAEAQSNAGAQTGGGQQAEGGGFTRGEKRSFIHTRAIHRVRSARVGDEAAWSYGSESKGTGGAVRLLKDLGVRYVEIWKAGRSLGTVRGTVFSDARVRGGGGEEEEFCSCGPYGVPNSGGLLAGVVVENDNIALAQGGHQHLFDRCAEDTAIDRPVDLARGGDRIMALQCPKGAFPIRRLACAAHPRSGVMLVLALVSSMNTRRCRSTPP